jgi:hypothetical protein
VRLVFSVAAKAGIDKTHVITAIDKKIQIPVIALAVFFTSWPFN